MPSVYAFCGPTSAIMAQILLLKNLPPGLGLIELGSTMIFTFL